jgi:hypothetical protein
MNTNFVAGHRYHTDCARSKYGQGQADNLRVLRERLDRAKAHGPENHHEKNA